MQLSQIKQMYVWTHKTSASFSHHAHTVMQLLRKRRTAPLTLNFVDFVWSMFSRFSFGTNTCWLFFLKKQNKNKTSTLNLKSYHYLPSNSQYSEMLSEAFLPWFLPTPYWFAISPSQFDI